MKVATQWLDEARPDVVCLQEIKTTEEKCPARVLAAAARACKLLRAP